MYSSFVARCETAEATQSNLSQPVLTYKREFWKGYVYKESSEAINFQQDQDSLQELLPTHMKTVDSVLRTWHFVIS